MSAPPQKAEPLVLNETELRKDAKSEGVVNPGRVRVNRNTELFKFLVSDYLVGFHKLKMLYYFQGRDPEPPVVPDTSVIPLFDANGEIEAEFLIATVDRAFDFLNPIGRETKKVDTEGEEMKLDPPAKAMEPTKLLAADWIAAFHGCTPDAEIIRNTSPAFAEALKNDRLLNGKKKSEEQVFCEWFGTTEERIKKVKNNEFLTLGRMVEEHHSRIAKGAPKRWNQFGGGATAIGITGGGLAFIAARRSPAENVRILHMNVGLTETPTARYRQKEAPKTEGQEKPVFYSELDPESVSPVWRSLHQGATEYEFENRPVRVAVSAQCSKVNVMAFFKPNGELFEREDGTPYARSYSVVIAQHTEGGTSGCITIPSPMGELVPTFIMVSICHVVLVVCSAHCKDDQGEFETPPHYHVLAFGIDGAGAIEPLSADWSGYLLQEPQLEPTNAPPRHLREAVNKGERLAFTCGAFDEFDPKEALFGTFDGGVVRVAFNLAKKTVDNKQVFYVSAESREEAHYLQPTLSQEVQLAQRPDAPPDSMKWVGQLRCAVTSIRSTGITAPTQSLSQRWCRRLLVQFEKGFAWRLGDGKDDCNFLLSTKGHRPSEWRPSPLLMVSIASKGTVLAMHSHADNKVFLFDMHHPREPIGNFGDNQSGGSIINNKEMPHNYDSLWMDVGRIVVLWPDGNVGFIFPASEEKIKARDEEDARQMEERMRLHEEERQKMEQMSRRLAELKVGEDQQQRETGPMSM